MAKKTKIELMGKHYKIVPGGRNCQRCAFYDFSDSDHKCLVVRSLHNCFDGRSIYVEEK